MVASKVKVSIMIPAYNVEEYIDRCLQSVFNQTLQDFEIIIVNDGSTDGTLERIQQYKDPRMKVINQKNKGVSAARNRGIEEATGEYLFQLDADDWFDSVALEKMYTYAKENDLDVLITDYFLNYREDEDIYQKMPSANSPEEYFRDVLLQRNLAYLWTRLYKTSLFKEYQITYPEGISLSEDFIGDLQAIHYAKKVGKLDEAYAHYYQREDSLSHSGGKYRYDDLEVSQLAKILLRDFGLDEEYKEELVYMEYHKVFLNVVTARNFVPLHKHSYNQIQKNLSLYFKNHYVREEIAEYSLFRKILIQLYRYNYTVGKVGRMGFEYFMQVTGREEKRNLGV